MYTIKLCVIIYQHFKAGPTHINVLNVLTFYSVISDLKSPKHPNNNPMVKSIILFLYHKLNR